MVGGKNPGVACSQFQTLVPIMAFMNYRWMSQNAPRAALICLLFLPHGSCSDPVAPADPAQPETDSPDAPSAAHTEGPASHASKPAGTRTTLGFELDGAVPEDDLGNFHVVLGIDINGKDVGDLTVELWTDAAPVTTRNFLRLADEGFYDGLTFHRILRDFMVQGGCPDGTGMGNSPYGKLQAEFSDLPERDHRYGVLSMARMGNDPNSASSQFFICCDDGPAHWNLDGKYTSFARLTDGVSTLEAMASVGVMSTGRENSKPTVPVVIREARVVPGPAPEGNMSLVRPGQDEGEGHGNARVIVQALVVGCSASGKPRDPKQAAELMAGYQTQIENGAEFMDLAAQFSDAGGVRDDVRRAVHRILAPGTRDREGAVAIRELQQSLQEKLRLAGERRNKHEITPEQYREISKGLNLELGDYLTTTRWRPSHEYPPGFLEVALDLEVGEIRLVEFDAALAPRGYTLLKRVE
jgi:peptidyl-prolyl cis-trans isomerase B (cyclophilin B)